MLFILILILINCSTFNVLCKFCRKSCKYKINIKGLLKYPIENEKLLVENWKQNVVYLVRYPRIASLPDLSVNSFKIECWLKLKNIKFYVSF